MLVCSRAKPREPAVRCAHKKEGVALPSFVDTGGRRAHPDGCPEQVGAEQVTLSVFLQELTWSKSRRRFP
jgi:hypothetical protein